MADRKSYKTFNRSSELAVKISGSSQAELFANSGFALFDIMTQMDKVEDNEHLTLEVEGTDRDDLMVNWMRELLYLYQGSSFLLKEVAVQEVKDTYIRGEVRGEKFDPDRISAARCAGRNSIPTVTRCSARSAPSARSRDAWKRQAISGRRM